MPLPKAISGTVTTIPKLIISQRGYKAGNLGTLLTVPKIEAESQKGRDRYRRRDRKRNRLYQSAKADSDCDCDPDPDSDADDRRPWGA
jgi:hypothetical protein